MLFGVFKMRVDAAAGLDAGPFPFASAAVSSTSPWMVVASTTSLLVVGPCTAVPAVSSVVIPVPTAAVGSTSVEPDSAVLTSAPTGLEEGDTDRLDAGEGEIGVVKDEAAFLGRSGGGF